MAKGRFQWGDEESSDAWGGRKKTPRVSDKCEMFDTSDGEWHTGRLVGPVVFHHNHWITIKTAAGKIIPGIPKVCLAAHGKLGEDETCPYCDNFGDPAPSGFGNVIDRAIQEEGEPRRARPPTAYEKKIRTLNDFEAYYKEGKGIGGYTCARVLPINGTLGKRINDTVALNKVTVKDKKGNKTKKIFPPDHPKHGYDLMVKYNNGKKVAANDRWSVQKGDRSPLTEEEMDILLWKIPDPVCENLKTAQKECENLMKKATNREGEPIFPDLFDADGKGGKKKKGNKNSFADEFDEDEDLEDDRPKKKNGKKSRNRDDDDDEEDERPSRGKKSRRTFEDDDDEDDADESEDDEEDDEDDRRSSRRSSSKKSSSKSRRRDDDDDDDEDERPRKKKRRNRDDDDDDEDDDIPF